MFATSLYHLWPYKDFHWHRLLLGVWLLLFFLHVLDSLSLLLFLLPYFITLFVFCICHFSSFPGDPRSSFFCYYFLFFLFSLTSDDDSDPILHSPSVRLDGCAFLTIFCPYLLTAFYCFFLLLSLFFLLFAAGFGQSHSLVVSPLPDPNHITEGLPCTKVLLSNSILFSIPLHSHHFLGALLSAIILISNPQNVNHLTGTLDISGGDRDGGVAERSGTCDTPAHPWAHSFDFGLLFYFSYLRIVVLFFFWCFSVNI